MKRALRQNERCVRAWIVLGELEAERGRAKAALAAWRRVPELDRRAGPLVYPQLEATYAALGRTREFETCLRGLLETRPDDRGARLALARSLAARGDAEPALAELGAGAASAIPKISRRGLRSVGSCSPNGATRRSRRRTPS